MRVLVTGGGGFLGSFLVERLRDRGDDVFVARRNDYDLTRWDDAERLFHDAQPEIVFHLAAEVGGIGANRANPGRYWFANLMMGAHVLELSRPGGREAPSRGHRLQLSEVHAHTVLRERALERLPRGDNAPYGVAKKALLVGAQAYQAQYDLESTYLLPANLYGPRDNFDLETSHVVPALISKMLAGAGEVVLWGDGSPTREFLYVEDAADAFVLASEVATGSDPINIGTGVEISIAELAKRSPSSRASAARSSGTPRCQTGSPGGGST